MRKRTPAALALAAVLSAGCAPHAPAPSPMPSPAPAAERAGQGPARPGAPGADRPASPGGPGGPAADRSGGEPQPKPYAQVVTPAAVTRDGLFRTHRIGSKLFFEIPDAELGREMLLVTQIAGIAEGQGYAGQAAGNRVVRWERRDNRVLLRSVSHQMTADSASTIFRSVDASSYAPIVATFNVEAFGPDSAAVIEVTSLYTTSSPEFGVGRNIRGNLDSKRSFIERVAAFPTNVEVQATHTYTVTPPSPPGLPEAFRPGPETVSALVHWSMVRLPENPMMPRLADDRVGFFTVSRRDFSRPEHGTVQREFITRWRLEKKDPGAALSEPVRPIVFYVDPATPPQWVPFVKRGIEAWQPAFETAGFRNAIVAAEAPSPAEDPDWSPEDARYSVIRWLPTTVMNAMGPHVHDPRTGEILEADVQIHHAYLEGLRDQYFFHVAPLDPRAQRLPFPDSLIGRLVQMVVTHEVGHSIGFPHNMKASSQFPVDSLRSPAFLARWGHTPSIMDYSRFNYVVQPEDGIAPEDLIRKVGPYDHFAVAWGYSPIPQASTPDEEKPVLDRWARRQETEPWLRFSTTNSRGSDPGELTEAIGDADAVRSSELGLRNVRRMVPILIPATDTPGESWGELSQLYGRVVSQWGNLSSHVVAVVGGMDSQEKYGGQEGVRFTPVARERQRAAMRFLDEHAWRTPRWLLDEQVLRRIEPQGAMDRIQVVQARLLNQVLSDARLARMVETEALAPRGARVYTPGEMLGDLRAGVWSELSAGSVRVDPFRRGLQRAYLDAVRAKLVPAPSRGGNDALTVFFGGSPTPTRAADDVHALLRGELTALDAALRSALPRAGDRTTRLHLESMRTEIDRILDPNG